MIIQMDPENETNALTEHSIENKRHMALLLFYDYLY